MTYTLRAYDVENMRPAEGEITRDDVQAWLDKNAGDFQSVIDFSASIEDGERTVEIPWKSEEGELLYLDTVSEGA